MRRFIQGMVLITILLIFPGAASGFEWKNMESLFQLSYQVQVAPQLSTILTYAKWDKRTDSCEAQYYYVGLDDTVYCGPSGRFLVLGGRVGAVSKWFPKEAVILGFQGTFAVNDKWWIGVQSEGYFGDTKLTEKAYYGFYLLSFRPILYGTQLVVGVGVEQNDEFFWGGGRVGVEKGFFSAELQHFVYAQKGSEGHNVRLTCRFVF